MAAETCAVCGETVPFDASAHVLLNPPDDPVRDGYLCPSCYENHFEGVLEHVEVAETGDEDDEDESADGEGTDGGDRDDEDADEEPATGDEAAGTADERDEDGPGDDPTDPTAEAETNDADS